MDVDSANLLGPGDFMQIVADSLAPDLRMRRLRNEDNLAQYAGLWSTWSVGTEQQRAAKFVLVTVLVADGQEAPAGPVELRSLLPWLVLQLHHLTEGSPAWDALAKALGPELGEDDHVTKSCAGRQQVRYDPTQRNHASRAVAEPTPLLGLVVQQWEPDSACADAAPQGLPQPAQVLNRRCLEYRLPAVSGIRAFVEKATPKNAVLSEMERNYGFARAGTVLGAINEWRTWFVADSLE